jgi:hypothetical protein
MDPDPHPGGSKKYESDGSVSGSVTNVADPGCLSQFPDPDFYSFRIPDPTTATKERVEKKCVVKPFFVATNFTKLKIILFFLMLKKKI